MDETLSILSRPIGQPPLSFIGKLRIVPAMQTRTNIAALPQTLPLGGLLLLIGL